MRSEGLRPQQLCPTYLARFVGFASNLRDALPNASFIGFTGTPIEKTDANTRAVGEMSNDEFQMSN